MKVDSNRLLFAWAGALTIGLGVVLLTGATGVRSQKFDVIDVQRINVREPDGTLRMVVSSRERFPGAILGPDREYDFDRGVAGMIFFNDEGMETGGLTFAGGGADGEVKSTVHLSFDPYERDQTVQLTERDHGDTESASLVFRDKSDLRIGDVMEGIKRIRALPADQQPAAMQALAPNGTTGPQRLVVGKSDDQRAIVDLSDADGNSRLRLSVTPEGQATIEVLDADGSVVGSITPESLRQ